MLLARSRHLDDTRLRPLLTFSAPAKKTLSQEMFCAYCGLALREPVGGYKFWIIDASLNRLNPLISMYTAAAIGERLEEASDDEDPHDRVGIGRDASCQWICSGSRRSVSSE